MDYAKTWRIDVFIDEHDGRTHARVQLTTGDNVLTGTGIARRRGADRDVPEIGDELAVARALGDLAHQLLEATAADLEQVTHEPARLGP